MKGNTVQLKQETRYPWGGKVRISVDPEFSNEFAVHLRIPGWARNKPVPGNLYRYLQKHKDEVTVRVNGKTVGLDIKKGFVQIRRIWKKGDKIDLDLPMPIRRVVSHENVKGNRGKVALERGPVVYCAEWVDNGGIVNDLVIPDDGILRAGFLKDVLNGIVVIRGKIPSKISGTEEFQKARDFTAIPYYAWSHRGEGEMMTWLRRK